MLDAVFARIAQLRRAPEVIAPRAAARIEAKLRADATTARGNVPSYGKFGDAPIEVTSTPVAIEVRAAGWVQTKARKEGQPEEWAEIVADEARAFIAGGT